MKGHGKFHATLYMYFWTMKTQIPCSKPSCHLCPLGVSEAYEQFLGSTFTFSASYRMHFLPDQLLTHSNSQDPQGQQHFTLELWSLLVNTAPSSWFRQIYPFFFFVMWLTLSVSSLRMSHSTLILEILSFFVVFQSTVCEIDFSELIWMWGVRCCRFHILTYGIQVLQHCLLSSLSLPWILFALLTRVRWLYWCGTVSVFFPLFLPSAYLSFQGLWLCRK